MEELKILDRDDSLDLVAFPGDTFELTYVNPLGKETTLLTEKIEEKTIINSVVAFRFKGIFGMKQGIGGAFGEKSETRFSPDNLDKKNKYNRALFLWIPFVGWILSAVVIAAVLILT